MIKVHLSRIMGEQKLNIADVSKLTGLHRNGLSKLYNEDTDAVDIYMPKGYYLSEEMIQKSLNESREQFSNFELWAYVHEIEDVEVKQIALNKLFYVYCSFFIHNEFIRKSSFKGFNS